MPAQRRALVPIGESGVYSVSEVCRILQPSMTSRKVHYWINTELLSQPLVYHGGAGVPTLLTFKQLLEVRTVQRVRDELRFSLRAVRDAFAWILETIFVPDITEVWFERGPYGTLVARSGDVEVVVPGGQYVIPASLERLNEDLALVQYAYVSGRFVVPQHEHIVCDVRVLGGAACLAGTRLDTALIGAFAHEGDLVHDVVAEVQSAYPRLTVREIEDALEFEGFDLSQVA